MWMRQLNVLLKPKYTLLAVSITWIVFTFSVWLPNIQLIGVVLFSSTASFMGKLSLFISLYGSIGTNFTTTSATYTILISILFGINISLLTYYIRKVRGEIQSIKITGVAGISGLISGIFGIGCASCGTFILTSFLALFGAGGAVAFLPFRGEEFGFIGVALLVYSIYTITKKLEAPFLCPVKYSNPSNLS